MYSCINDDAQQYTNNENKCSIAFQRTEFVYYNEFIFVSYFVRRLHTIFVATHICNWYVMIVDVLIKIQN